MSENLYTLVTDKPVVLCLGSGGVGKTTVAATVAIGFAQRGERVVVLTIDPARRLAEVLGFTVEGSNEPTLLRSFPPAPKKGKPTGELWATMLDASETFTDLVRAEANSDAQAERILSNPLFRNLTRSLSGTSEYMAAERLHRLLNDERFDRVVVDTPPSRHAFDFLDAPSQLVRFVDHRIYRTVFAPKGLARTASLGTRMILRVLGQMVGGGLVDEVVRFFSDFETMDAGFRQRASELDELLAGPQTGYVLVTAPRRDPLLESRWISSKLDERGRTLSAAIVNRACPVVPSGSNRPRRGLIAQNLNDFENLAISERRLVEELLAPEVPVCWVSERTTPVRQFADLEALAAALDS